MEFRRRPLWSLEPATARILNEISRKASTVEAQAGTAAEVSVNDGKGFCGEQGDSVEAACDAEVSVVANSTEVSQVGWGTRLCVRHGGHETCETT